MLKHTSFKALSISLLLSFAFNLSAKNNDSLYDEKLAEGETRHVISSVNTLLDKNYIFPEVSEQIRQLLERKLNNGEYAAAKSGHGLAQLLTADVQAVSKDRHLRVYFDPKRVERTRQSENEVVDPAEEEKERLIERTKNHGFKQVSILDGNVGYVDLRHFAYPDEASETVAATMAFLQNTDALIFDLRQNGGGSPAMVQLLVSYLLDEEQVHLNDIYKRNLNQTKQYWSLPSVPGKRLPDVDVYVLTSKGTFSAAEDFSYTLKHLERATIIGETTGGGAHPGGRQIATDRFMVWVPTARSINPVTGTNWEGVGVIPHVEQPAGRCIADGTHDGP